MHAKAALADAYMLKPNAPYRPCVRAYEEVRSRQRRPKLSERRRANFVPFVNIELVHERHARRRLSEDSELHSIMSRIA